MSLNRTRIQTYLSNNFQKTQQITRRRTYIAFGRCARQPTNPLCRVKSHLFSFSFDETRKTSENTNMATTGAIDEELKFSIRTNKNERRKIPYLSRIENKEKQVNNVCIVIFTRIAHLIDKYVADTST